MIPIKRLYVDGELSEEQVLKSVKYAEDSNYNHMYSVGADKYGKSFDGWIDDVILYKVELDEVEVDDLYDGYYCAEDEIADNIEQTIPIPRDPSSYYYSDNPDNVDDHVSEEPGDRIEDTGSRDAPDPNNTDANTIDSTLNEKARNITEEDWDNEDDGAEDKDDNDGEDDWEDDEWDDEDDEEDEGDDEEEEEDEDDEFGIADNKVQYLHSIFNLQII